MAGLLKLGRVFKGQTFALPKDAGENPNITSVTTKDEGKTFFTTLNKSGNWDVRNGSIEFFNTFPDVNVSYEIQSTIEEITPVIGHDAALGLASFRAKLQASAEDFQADKISLEGSTVKDFQTVGGVKAVQDFAKPFQKLTDKTLFCKTTGSFGDGVREVSTQISAITSITKRSSTGNGALRRISTQFNPASIKNAAKKIFPTKSESKIREFSTGSSINPSKALEVLRPDKEPKLRANREVETVYKEKIKSLNDCGSNLDPTSLLGGIGRSKQNAFAHLISKARSVIQDPSSAGDTLAELKASNINIPSNNLTSLIKNAQTNVRSNLSKGEATSSNVKPSSVFDITSVQSGFAGYKTSPNYVFTTVSSPEELYLEIANSTRTRSKESDSIRCLVVGWTSHLDGPPEKANAKKIHELSKKFDLKNLENEIGLTSSPTDAGKKALETINRKFKLFGIQPHYIIKRNGDLERGRPINETRNPDYAPFALSGLKIAFVATQSKPVNEEQFKTFDMFINEFFKVFPGGEVIADSELNNEYTGPGFNVKDRVNAKHKRQFIIEDPSTFTEMPSKVAQCITKPKKVLKPSNSGTFSLDFNKINREAAHKIKSDKYKNDLAAAQNALKTDTPLAINDFNNKLRDLNKAIDLPAGDTKNLLDTSVVGFDTKLNAFADNIDTAIEGTQQLDTQIQRTATAIQNANQIDT